MMLLFLFALFTGTNFVRADPFCGSPDERDVLASVPPGVTQDTFTGAFTTNLGRVDFLQDQLKNGNTPLTPQNGDILISVNSVNNKLTGCRRQLSSDTVFTMQVGNAVKIQPEDLEQTFWLFRSGTGWEELYVIDGTVKFTDNFNPLSLNGGSLTGLLELSGGTASTAPPPPPYSGDNRNIVWGFGLGQGVEPNVEPKPGDPFNVHPLDSLTFDQPAFQTHNVYWVSGACGSRPASGTEIYPDNAFSTSAFSRNPYQVSNIGSTGSFCIYCEKPGHYDSMHFTLIISAPPPPPAATSPPSTSPLPSPLPPSSPPPTSPSPTPPPPSPPPPTSPPPTPPPPTPTSPLPTPPPPSAPVPASPEGYYGSKIKIEFTIDGDCPSELDLLKAVKAYFVSAYPEQADKIVANSIDLISCVGSGRRLTSIFKRLLADRTLVFTVVVPPEAETAGLTADDLSTGLVATLPTEVPTVGTVTAVSTTSLGTAKVDKDPHLSLPNGGKADFRGKNNTLYNFLSSPGLSLNIRTNDATFLLNRNHHHLIVDGSFITEAHIVTNHMKMSLYTSETSGTLKNTVRILCDDQKFALLDYASKVCKDTEVKTKYSSVFVTTPNFKITLKPNYVYNHHKGATKRLDISIHRLKNEKAHGIIGQSYGRPYKNGNQDIYPLEGTFKTSAMAEGVIDGTAEDYELKDVHSTDFKYSIFHKQVSLLLQDVDELASVSDEN